MRRAEYQAWMADTSAAALSFGGIRAPGAELELDGPTYDVEGRSVLLLVERQRGAIARPVS